jgi:hypothetical protein
MIAQSIFFSFGGNILDGAEINFLEHIFKNGLY